MTQDIAHDAAEADGRVLSPDLSLAEEGSLRAAIRFVPERQWSAEMQEGCRLAAERAPHLLFPDTAERVVIPWNPARSAALLPASWEPV